METTSRELPEDCWALIISRVDHHRQWESISMVSKKFLSITNHLRVTLEVINPSTKILSIILRRFPNLKSIDLSQFQGSLEQALLEIARSGLDIEELNISNQSNCPIMPLKELAFKMKNIKILRCPQSFLTNSDLKIVAEFFPLIEELDISEQGSQDITDEGIIELSTNLKFLERIDLTGNKRISDQSLISLSSNCEFLTEIVLRDCPKVTQDGLFYLMRNSRNYNSLILASSDLYPITFTRTLDYSSNLSFIDFYRVKISDEFLHGFVREDLPLKHFHLSFCTNFTLEGISFFLKAYQSLESLALGAVDFLTDEYMSHLCQFIPNLMSIKLNPCFGLTAKSFITIALACPSIRTIDIGSSFKETRCLDYDSSSFAKNPSITSVSLTSLSLKGLFNICPNLQVLNVTNLPDSGQLNIAEVIHLCSEITHLTLNYCKKLKFSVENQDEQFCNLESLSIRNSGIDDQILGNFAKMCPELINLELIDCKEVTDRGVKEVVQICEKLRYVNLNWCCNVNTDIVSWMVDTRTSLRRIVTPRERDHTEEERNVFLEQGCLVYPGTWG